MRDERLFPLFQPVDKLPGIGPKLKPVFERLVDGETVWDLLLHLPEKWLDRRVRDSFQDLVSGEVSTVRGEVMSYKAPYSDRAPHRIQLFDGSGFLTLTYFRADPRWLQGQFPIGKERIVSGLVSEFQGERQMSHPDHVVDPTRGEPPPPVEPIYRLTAGLTNKRVHSAMTAALELVPEDLPEWLGSDLVAAQQWPGFKAALSGLHTPDAYDPDAFELARRRLSYDEALAREIIFAFARESRTRRTAPPLEGPNDPLNALSARLPYKLTSAQRRAVREIADDVARPHPMRRMLQGDVGAGKTLVAVMAALKAVSSGYQAAFMAPTEVLARQQFETVAGLLAPLGHEVAILTGREKGPKRESTLMGLADGSIHVAVGTQALFQESVSFRNLGLIVVDEQHRFGVADRMRLIEKASAPHMLVMSATPIPRTLAQAVHGDLDISVLDEKPAGRQPIETRAIPDTRIEDVVEAIGRAIDRGERVFWVCPRVDSDEDDSSAVARAAALEDWLGQKVGLVHGRLRGDQKDEALEAFRRGDTKVLVATTVIEVGVDVPDATVMVIERAEGFGLAQLHQLRGRVGRGDRKSYCILLYRPPLGEIAHKRLETLRETEDGFAIAEADFKLRGPGDVLGVRQSGAVDYRIVDLQADADLIEIARKDARYAIETDPGLTSDRGQALSILRELLSPLVRQRE
ncbi:ATP-dependent DNA helicase RecG [Henriciella barbarensis]|uniref:Probable DNA 3'-5' helicase RecG n=1 Tax=Henriciella barbarensis TaxID=86342 RepID=A0A399R3N6_9PROT|nr:ATP-dependent DNA helicase RecG [Henriciella barbarensis]RIJ26136.1 ATP-dependent DNA helicase RecG [Henriciella barbarensis]